MQLFWDYQFNLDSYPQVPGVLPYASAAPAGGLGGEKNDEIFGAAGAEAYRRDLPGGEFHLLDTGHFALETHGEEISVYIREFMRQLPGS